MFHKDQPLSRPRFLKGRPLAIIFIFAAVAQFLIVASFAASTVDYSRDNCSIIFPSGSAASDGIVSPGETFPASFSVYNGSPSVNNSSQELWPSNSGPTPASTRFKLVPSTGSNYDSTWTGGNTPNVPPYTAELYGGTNSGYGYVIGRLNGVDARTGLGNGTYKAPATEGTYAFKFQLKQAGGAWHPTATCAVNLQVKKPSSGTGGTQQPRVNPYVCNKPYPSVLKAGDRNNTGGRSDQCVTAVQYALQAASANFSAPALTGTIDATTVSYIRNFQGFFNLPVTGQLSASDIDGIAKVFGAFKTSTVTGGGGGGGGGSGNQRGPNPYVCNKPYPSVALGYKDKVGRKDQCVSAVQYNLQAALPTLKVSGVVGTDTEKAIRNFQAFFKLPVTGRLSAQEVELVGKALGAYKTDGTSGGGGGGGGNTGSGKLHVLIAGANFGTTPASNFTSIAEQTIKLISSTAPYSSYKANIVFHKVQLPNYVSCAPSGATGDGRDWRCDYEEAARQIAALGVPADKVIMFANSQAYGGSANGVGGRFSTSTLYSAFTALHEFSHSMGLWDEYLYGAYGGAEPGPNSAKANCRDNGPNEFWRAGDPEFSGCSYGSWRRGAQTSIMSTHGGSGFSAPAVRVLENTIKSYANSGAR